MPHLDWLKKIKLAIINEDIEKIEALSNTIPKFNTLRESEEALSLIEQASQLIKKEQLNLKSQLEKIENTKKYLL